MIWQYNHVTSSFQLLDEDKSTEMVTIDETKGTTIKSKWIFEIFHGEFVHGIRQTFKDGSGNSPVTVGCTDGEPQRIELMAGEQVIKVTFSGWDSSIGYCK